MRKVLILALMCLIAIGLYAQTNPFFTEDWENGIGDWQIVNHNVRVNKWFLGDVVPPASGETTHTMYISNDGGVTNAYTIAGQPVRAHFYRDISIYITQESLRFCERKFDIFCHIGIDKGHYKDRVTCQL